MEILVFILLLVISALPLYLAVKILGGKASILKTIVVNILVGAVVWVINYLLNAWASIVAFILVIWIYREMFRLKWIKAFLAWILQFIIMAVLVFLVGLFGLSVVSLI